MVIVPGGTSGETGKPVLSVISVDGDPTSVSSLNVLPDLKEPVSDHCTVIIDENHLMVIQPGPQPPIMGLYNKSRG